MPTPERHDSFRGYFAYELYLHMQNNKDIFVLTGDLGYGMLDYIKRDFPERFINCGAAEQAMMGIAVGLALEGKIPVVYSITTFLLYRPFETIRNYINHEQIPVKLVGSGRGKDYKHDGFSHWSEDAWKLFSTPAHDKAAGTWIKLGFFSAIEHNWPKTKEEIPGLMEDFLYDKKPHFLSLRR